MCANPCISISVYAAAHACVSPASVDSDDTERVSDPAEALSGSDCRCCSESRPARTVPAAHLI